jgi:hypothetical protein
MANTPAGPDQPTGIARPKSARLQLVPRREVAEQGTAPGGVPEGEPASVHDAHGTATAGADLPEQGAGGDGAPRREVVSQKELARLYRRQAYQRAKAYRAADPKYARLKEVAKLRRRELYQQIKQTRKAAALVDKSANKAARSAQRTEERAAKRRELRNGLKGGSIDSSAVGARLGRGSAGRYASAAEGNLPEGNLPENIGAGALGGGQGAGQRSPAASVQRNGKNLQSEIQAALQNKRVSTLLARVRMAGEQPDVIANEACSSAEVVPLSRSRRAKEGSPG